MNSFRSEIVPAPKYNGAIPIPRQILICLNTLKSSAKTLGFDNETSSWIAEKLCGNLTKDETALFATLMFTKINTGRYALSFRDLLFNIIENVDIPSLVRLARESKEYLFPELYDNPYFTEDDFKTVELMFDMELNAMKTLLTQGESLDNFNKYFANCHETSIKFATSAGSEGLYSKCFSDVCIFQSNSTNYIDLAQSRMPSQTVSFPENTPEGLEIWCFEQSHIVEILATEQKINPETGLPFSEKILNMLKLKFDKEIKMYKRYLDNYQ